MRFTLTIYLTFIVTLSFSQEKYETNLIYKISWENELSHEYYEGVGKGKSSINSSKLIKNDTRYLEESENVVIDFLLKNLEKGNLTGLTDLGGDTLSKKQIFERIYWKWNINIDHGDTMRWKDSDSIQYLEIHQEWIVDTIENSISNKIIGVSILRETDKEEVTMFYIPFDNEYASKIINVPKIIFIRQLSNKYSWKAFPKKKVARILTKTNEAFYLLENSNNPVNIQNVQTNKLDSLYSEIDLSSENLPDNILNHSEGIHLNQYLYIDYENVKINTLLNAIAPMFAMYDYKGNFKYYKSLYWLVNKEIIK